MIAVSKKHVKVYLICVLAANCEIGACLAPEAEALINATIKHAVTTNISKPYPAEKNFHTRFAAVDSKIEKQEHQIELIHSRAARQAQYLNEIQVKPTEPSTKLTAPNWRQEIHQQLAEYCCEIRKSMRVEERHKKRSELIKKIGEQKFKELREAQQKFKALLKAGDPKALEKIIGEKAKKATEIENSKDKSNNH